MLDYYADIPVIFEFVITIILGAVLGSFTTMLADRVYKNKTWLSLQERSHCPSCQTTLQVKDLVPLLSWLFLKGKCAHCKKQIPIIYPAIELTLIVLCVLIYLVQGLTVHSLIVMITTPFLVALLITDIRLMILPNRLVLIVGIVALFDKSIMFAVEIMEGQPVMTALQPLGIALLTALLLTSAALLVSKIMYLVTKRESLGMGDIKFFFVAGLWLTPSALPYYAILAGATGVLSALTWQYIKKASAKEPFPFGPSLIIALYILILFESFYI